MPEKSKKPLRNRSEITSPFLSSPSMERGAEGEVRGQVLNNRFRLRHFICVGAILLILTLLLWFTLLTKVRVTYQHGMDALTLKSYETALSHLDAAAEILPPSLLRFLSPRDLFRIQLAQAKALYGKAREGKRNRHFFDTMKAALPHIETAVTLAPFSYTAQHLQAKITHQLQIYHPYFKTKKDRHNPYNALPHYEMALALRPAGITIHYEILKYMAIHKITQGFDEKLKETVSIYPQAYNYLKKEKFYTPDLLKVMEEGVLAAVENGTTLRVSYGVLSSIYQKMGDADKAAEAYEKMITFHPEKNGYANYLQLGQLYLMAGEIPSAHEMFLKGVTLSPHRSRALRQIYRYYRNAEDLEGFMTTCDVIETTLSSFEALDLAKARCRMAMELFELARAILIQRIADTPSAPAYDMLASIAQKQKDYPEMERSSQRATMLDPRNPTYWIRFSTALIHQKKLERSEMAATRAVDLAKSDGQKISYRNHRAWVRWRQKDWQGSIADWQEVLKRSPKSGGYAYHISRAYANMSQYGTAWEYAKKAVALQPDKEAFVAWEKKMAEKVATTPPSKGIADG